MNAEEISGSANWGATPLGLARVRFILRQGAVRRINGLCRAASEAGGGIIRSGQVKWCSLTRSNYSMEFHSYYLRGKFIFSEWCILLEQEDEISFVRFKEFCRDFCCFAN